MIGGWLDPSWTMSGRWYFRSSSSPSSSPDSHPIKWSSAGEGPGAMIISGYCSEGFAISYDISEVIGGQAQAISLRSSWTDPSAGRWVCLLLSIPSWVGGTADIGFALLIIY